MALTRTPQTPAGPTTWDKRNLGTLRLYLDDIQDVLDQLALRGGKPRLTAGTSVADAALDLKDATRRELREVKIFAFGGDLTLTLTSQVAQIGWRTTNIAATDAGKECTALLAERRLPGPVAFAQLWAQFAAWTVALFGSMLILGVVISLIRGDGTPNWSGVWVVGAVVLVLPLSVALLTLVDPYSRTSQTVIYPLLRREARELSVTRRGAWTVGLVTAVVSAVLGVGLTLWFTNFT